MFDLNQTTAQWRTTLSAQPGFRDSDLDELEDHLREQISELTEGGLNEEEAFIIASRRLGPPEDLGGEFAIASPEQRRSFRLRWMLTGGLAIILMWLVADMLTNVGTGALVRLSDNMDGASLSTGFGWMAGALRILLLVLGGAFVWHLAATDRTAHRMRRFGGGSVILFTLLIAFLLLASRTASEIFIFHGLSTGSIVNITKANTLLAGAMMLVLPVLMLWGLWRLIRS